jgi:hypothetical protein
MKKREKKTALTINYDSTKDSCVSLIAHTVEYGRMELVSLPLTDLLAIAEKSIEGAEKLHQSVAMRTKARRRVLYEHKNVD